MSLRKKNSQRLYQDVEEERKSITFGSFTIIPKERNYVQIEKGMFHSGLGM